MVWSKTALSTSPNAVSKRERECLYTVLRKSYLRSVQIQIMRADAAWSGNLKAHASQIVFLCLKRYVLAQPVDICWSRVSRESVASFQGVRVLRTY